MNPENKTSKARAGTPLNGELAGPRLLPATPSRKRPHYPRNSEAIFKAIRVPRLREPSPNGGCTDPGPLSSPDESMTGSIQVAVSGALYSVRFPNSPVRAQRHNILDNHRP